MPTITAIEPQRRCGRVNIFVDGVFVIGVGEEVAASTKLSVGRSITDQSLRDIASTEELRRATEVALRMLDHRPQTVREVASRLKQKGYEPGTVDSVIGKLRDLELLDDADFARQWVEARSRPDAGRPLGKQRLASELYLKGVAKEQITEAVGSISGEDDLAAARAAARKKVRAIPTDPDELRAEQRRLMSFLQRRGFGWETVKIVVHELLSLSEDTQGELYGDHTDERGDFET